jgi:hypothetical protein
MTNPTGLAETEIIKAIDNIAVVQFYDMGHAEGFKKGEKAGRSTLNVGWFFAVCLAFMTAGMIVGVAQGILMERHLTTEATP